MRQRRSREEEEQEQDNTTKLKAVQQSWGVHIKLKLFNSMQDTIVDRLNAFYCSCQRLIKLQEAEGEKIMPTFSSFCCPTNSQKVTRFNFLHECMRNKTIVITSNTLNPEEV